MESGLVFEGEYANNERNGHGKVKWPNGTTFEGIFVGNHLQEGVLSMSDGSIYKAEFICQDTGARLQIKLIDNEGLVTESLFCDGHFVESYIDHPL